MIYNRNDNLERAVPKTDFIQKAELPVSIESSPKLKVRIQESNRNNSQDFLLSKESPKFSNDKNS